MLSVVPTTILVDGMTMTMPTLYQDRALSLLREGGLIVVNGAATILASDILANNGIVHLIDKVIPIPTTRTPTVTPTTLSPTEDLLGAENATAIPTSLPTTMPSRSNVTEAPSEDSGSATTNRYTAWSLVLFTFACFILLLNY